MALKRAKWSLEARRAHAAVIRQKRHPHVSDAQYLERLKSLCIMDANGCWLYQGFLRHNGYGCISYRCKNWVTHRLAYHLTKGEIPKGMDVCHTCDVRNCCNPEHLWVGTRQDNMIDMSKKKRHPQQAKTHCFRGHEFTPENTYWAKHIKTFLRSCKICARARGRIKAGWPEDLAYSAGVVPHGFKIGAGKWQRRPRSESKEGSSP